MNKIWIIVLGALVFAACHSTLGSRVGAPKIKLSSDTINLGTVRVGDSVLTTVDISNTGDDSLQIIKLGFSCGCTAASLPKRTLGKNERVTLNIKYLNQGDESQLSKAIILENNSAEPFKVLRLIGNGAPK